MLEAMPQSDVTHVMTAMWSHYCIRDAFCAADSKPYAMPAAYM